MNRLLHFLALALIALSLGACTASDNSSEDSSEDADISNVESSEYSGDEAQYLIEEPDYLIEPDPSADKASVLSEDSVQGMGYIPEGNALEGEPFVSAQATALIPVEDRRYLCGHSSNVFVGEVMAEVSTTPLESDADQYDSSVGPVIPQVQYSVALADMGTSTYDPEVKGALDPATSTGTSGGRDLYLVNQAGGQLSAEDPVVIPNGDPLLMVGDEALFFVNWDEDKEWYTIIFQPQGDIRAPTNIKELEKLIRLTKHGCHYERTPEQFEEEMVAALEAGSGSQEQTDSDMPPLQEGEK